MTLQPGLALASALLLAWALDLAFGEPRNAWHPVAWLGRAMKPVGQVLQGLSPVPAFVGGALVWCLFAMLLGSLAWMLQAVLLSYPFWLAVPVLALLLKPLFAWRMLRDEVAAVEDALANGEPTCLPAARARLSRLVSRDVSLLDATAVRETAIETLAENLNDSLVAPLFWFAVAGLPGAAVYRFANTADAMWGYRGAWEWAGKWSARADDVLSWLPARLTAVLLRPSLRLADWKALRFQAAQTPSPNGGWPMGAMALRLGVRLRKPGVYALNDGALPPSRQHLLLALRHASLASGGAVAVAAIFSLARWTWS
jgi:adenosylcobinamide-phosphate synthase